MASSGAYDKTVVNTVQRYGKERASYDYKTIHQIIDSTPVLHVSFNPAATTSDPFPAILPMIGCTGSFASPSADPAAGPLDLYIHGYVSSRLMKSPSTHPSGTPVAVAATLLDGLVLALTPNHHSCNFRSAIAFGYAVLVTEEKEKLYAMQLITDNMLPTRWANSRIPPTKAEMTSTSVLRVSISHASAKVRAGGPGEDRADLKDEELRKRVWTGVVPAWIQWGEPIPAEGNRVNEMPEYVEGWRNGENRDGRVGAYEAAMEK
ncbi:putative FMN binding protein [Lepidopterella palustris CBS 459.81]|uniref:Putative FMN binding protein n=1 Tax=Lepidopterella palustris CBS 459.81 TaxID=1314670 RepID=A0A8E2EES0_9PEZI|nr:putative FMN binding protein [Lepidopterella palustris CBS 459.81]